jgi:hypothetical protein
MKKITSLVIISIAALTASAQKKLSHTETHRITWENNPVLHPVPPEYKNEPAFFIVRDESIDYRHEGKNINTYFSTHYIVKVLTETGIEYFKSTGISVNSDTRVPLIKARTIMADGKVAEVSKDMIKVTRDEYGRNKIVFAMEGLTKNAEVEVLVNEIKPMALFGTVDFQYSIPVMSSTFEMSYPKYMMF